MFEPSNLGTILYQVLIIGLFLLFFISFAFFIRRLVLNSNHNLRIQEIEKKLEKIIKLLEEQDKK
ncbi:DUF4083 family protein [Halalkalibacterium halodurans]|uniref:DUF4083 family protein n=1 Tax=Halalkalibacterium halodurans TaxID=86665 RepID=UPI001F25DF07|nr:DUF4083 family protein [Halalkalibacterium halodurans]MED4082586.1 DUF4083 family protein [Halalkalibacterium halodurans]MED4086729.1 DUF4083 family protein [Halalkalibacterium halodurans]MED4105587.1 DUF4083 family protein [Halalkalibacterium halodurans]MED4110580.1 DUF4083 family protein [Halalkalibacterium halodurans]MED4124871.1 DUF4083 family protein [Halalkalibacterium halodurans]